MTTSIRKLMLSTASVFLATAVHAGAQCEALLFDGVGDIASVIDAHGDFDLGSAMTVEAWVRVDAAQSGGGFVAAFEGGGGGSWLLGGDLVNPSTAIMGVSTPITDSVFAPNAIHLGTWMHFAGTFDGTRLRIFVDGALVATHFHVSPGNSSNVASLVLGMFPVVGSGLFFKGAMDEVRIWDVVRTPSEILQHYMLPLSGDEPGLVGYYKFDEGGGDVIVDSSLFGNNGFLGASAGLGPDDPTRIPSGVSFTCSNPGTPYCFGDAGGLCPCGNTAGAGEGCANSSGAGGSLAWRGSASVGSDDLAFDASNLLPAQPALLFDGENAPGGGLGLPFGDGLRCAGFNVVRLGVAVPDSDGDASWGPGLGAIGGWSSNDTRYFQVLYRDTNGPCASGFNATNGVEIAFSG